MFESNHGLLGSVKRLGGLYGNLSCVGVAVAGRLGGRFDVLVMAG